VKRVAVLGAGAWGTSIASVLAGRLDVTLWARDPAQAEVLARTRRNERYLRGVEIPAAGQGHVPPRRHGASRT
jgi:glycerol-3-phosphate dehydrogenase (NAD(P)+)